MPRRRDVIRTSNAAILLALVAVAAGARPALAQPAPARPVTAGSPASKEEARRLFDEAKAEYRAGRYDRAIELFQEAYRLSGVPAILFNIAQAYRRKGFASCEPAERYYRRALEEEPNVGNRAEIEERIREMQRCQQAAGGPAAEPPPEPGPATTIAAAAPRPRRPLGPMVTGAAGAAALVTGGVVYLAAREKFGDLQETCPCDPDRYSGWKMATNISYVMMGAGTVALGAGLAWWSLERERGERPRMTLLPTVGGVQWVGEF
jgi:tetratricopeptide (TPR) repeat protein